MQRFSKYAILGAALVLLSSATFAADPWSDGDIAREVAWQALHLIDWGQTRSIAKNPDQYRELNPILGEHPSIGRVNTYMAASAIAHIIVSDYLSGDWRTAWQWVTIGITASAVHNNYRIGLRLDF